MLALMVCNMRNVSAYQVDTRQCLAAGAMRLGASERDSDRGMVMRLRSYASLWARARQIMVCSSVAVVVMFASAVTQVDPASAQDNNAQTILKKMASYIASQKTISATFDANIEVVLPSLQKIQFTSSGQLQLNRPNGLRARRSGGYSDVELIFDGTTATIVGHHDNTFAQIKSAGSIDDLVHRLRDEHGVMVPGADLLLATAYEELTANAIEVTYIGHGVVDGKEVEHIAFRGLEVDWQLWVEIGPNPIPRKYVITSKTVTGAPQYTVQIKNWTTGAAVNADVFTFTAPAGAKKVEVSALAGIDEVPEGIIVGGTK